MSLNNHLQSVTYVPEHLSPISPARTQGRVGTETAAQSVDHSLIIAIAMTTSLYATTRAFAESSRIPEIAVSGNASLSRG
jgi:hypothetical protein